MLGDAAFKSPASPKKCGPPQHTSALNNLVQQAAGRLFMMQSLYHLDLRVGQDDPMLASMHGWLKEPGTLYDLDFYPPSVGEADIFSVFCATGIDRQRIELLWTRGCDTSVNVFIKPPLQKVARGSGPGTPSAATPASSATPAAPAASAVPVADEEQQDTEHYVSKVILPEKWRLVKFENLQRLQKEAQQAAAAAAAATPVATQMPTASASANSGNVGNSDSESDSKNLVSKIFNAATSIPRMVWAGLGSVIGNRSGEKRGALTNEAGDSPRNKKGRAN